MTDQTPAEMREQAKRLGGATAAVPSWMQGDLLAGADALERLAAVISPAALREHDAKVRAEALTDLEPGDLADLLQGISEGLEGLAHRDALRRAADVLRLLVPDEQDEAIDRMGPAAGCAYCVGAGGYEDYDGEWCECSCQQADREPSDAEVLCECGFSEDLHDGEFDAACGAFRPDREPSDAEVLAAAESILYENQPSSTRHEVDWPVSNADAVEIARAALIASQGVRRG